MKAFKRSCCPITNTLDILGDRWSLLIVRDLYLGKRAYGELLESPENIASNILAERLKRLYHAGIIAKKPYRSSPVRYEYYLTDKGWDLLPVLRAINEWASKYIDGVECFAPYSAHSEIRE